MGHNFNNLRGGQLDDVTYMSIVVSDKNICENCILKTFLLPHDLLMQQVRTIWIILVGDHTGIIPIEFGQIPISSLGEE